MTVVAIDNTLRKLLQTTDVGSYNSLYYEILTLLANPDLANDLSRYNRLFNDSILPGEFNYDLHVGQRIFINNIEETRKQLSFKFCSLLSNITPKRHQRARYYSEEYLRTLQVMIQSICNTLFDPDLYRKALRYHDGLIYSIPGHNKSYEVVYPTLNYEHFIYRRLDSDTYYATKLDFIQGNHSSTTFTSSSTKLYEFTPLYNHLYPENAI